jgi:hypothetical protein
MSGYELAHGMCNELDDELNPAWLCKINQVLTKSQGCFRERPATAEVSSNPR